MKIEKRRTDYVKRNFFWGSINQIAAIGAPFLVRTILIYKLGGEFLGLNSLFSSILQVFSMADMGFSSAITYYLYKPLAQRDVYRVCALMGFYKKAYRIIGCGLFVVGFLLMPFVPFLIKGDLPEGINVYLLYFLYLVNTVISYLFFAYKNVLLSASQRQDVLNNIDTIIVVMRSIVQILFLYFLSDYYLYVICLPIFTLISNIFVAVVTKKIYPEYICTQNLSHKDIYSIITQVKGLLIGKIATISRNSFDTIIISIFLGLVEAGIYSNYYYVFSSVLRLITLITESMRGSVGNSIAIESKDKNYQDFIRFNYYIAWIGSWCTICLLCLYQPFMRLWTKDELIAPNRTMILFCIYFYIMQLGQIRAVYSSASGIWWEFRYLSIGEMITNPILNIILGYLWGMDGVLCATIFSVAVFSIIGIGKKTLRIYFQRKSQEYFVEMILYIIVTVLVSFITYYVCSFVNNTSYIYVISIRLIICCVLPNVLFFVLSLCRKKYRTYLKRLKDLL